MPAGRKPDLQRRRRIAAMTARGMSCAAIGRALGVTRECVRYKLHRMANPTPPRTAACEGCGQTIAFDGMLPRDLDGALCLSCLAERPHTPIGQRIKAFRLAAGISKEELARRVGLTLGTVLSYETGEREPTWPSLTRLIEVLGVGLVALGFEGFTVPETPTVAVSKKRHRPRKPR